MSDSASSSSLPSSSSSSSSSSTPQLKQISDRLYIRNATRFSQLNINGCLVTIIGELHNNRTIMCNGETNAKNVHEIITQNFRVKNSSFVMTEYTNESEIGNIGSFNINEICANRENLIGIEIRRTILGTNQDILYNPSNIYHMLDIDLINQFIRPYYNSLEYINKLYLSVASYEHQQIIKQFVDNLHREFANISNLIGFDLSNYTFYSMKKSVMTTRKEIVDKLQVAWAQFLDFYVVVQIFIHKDCGRDIVLLVGQGHADSVKDILSSYLLKSDKDVPIYYKDDVFNDGRCMVVPVFFIKE